MGFNRLREIEVSLVCDAEQTHVLLELDRAFRGDGYLYFSLPNNATLSQVQEIFRANLG